MELDASVWVDDVGCCEGMLLEDCAGDFGDQDWRFMGGVGLKIGVEVFDEGCFACALSADDVDVWWLGHCLVGRNSTVDSRLCLMDFFQAFDAGTTWR